MRNLLDRITRGVRSVVAESSAPDGQLIRVLSDQGKPWHDAEISIETAIKETFSLSAEEGVSVFLAADEREEVRILAGHALTRTVSKSAVQYLLRLPARYVEAFELKQTPGGTGAKTIDVLHRDIFGDYEQYKELCDKLKADQKAGFDLVRVVSPKVVWPFFAEFEELPAADLTTKARRKLRHYRSSAAG